jgi:hypothetical protein
MGPSTSTSQTSEGSRGSVGGRRRRKGRIRRTGRAALALALLALGPMAATASSATWNIGDVFVGVGNGKYKVYDNSGTFKETIDQGNQATYTTGCAFDSKFDLYTTNFGGGQVIKFAGGDPHSILQTITATSGAEDVVFDQAGNFYVTSARSAPVIHKYDASGTFVKDYNTGESDWLDLAANQTTMFFTGEELGNIKRFDLASNTALTAFGNVDAYAYALRLLPPGDGSGGLLVADTATIKRLNGTGAVTQTYDAPNQDQWFALNLDPNGTSFWSGDLTTGNVYRFNIATGAIEVGPIAVGAAYGICVKGERTAAISPPAPPAPPPSSPVGAAAPPPASVPLPVPAKATVSVAGLRTACVSTVTVSIDGHQIQTTKKSKFKLSVNVRKLKPGRHTLTVVAVDSRNRTTTTRRSFLRCAQKAVVKPQPKFTG